jgi:hypothetical protein
VRRDWDSRGLTANQSPTRSRCCHFRNPSGQSIRRNSRRRPREVTRVLTRYNWAVLGERAVSTGKCRTFSEMVLLLVLLSQMEFNNASNSNRVEARGVEPLSVKRSAKPSTCLDDLSFQSDAADRHATGSIAATESIHLTPRSPRRKASLLPACPFLAGVSTDTSRRVRPRERDLRNLRLSF